MEEPPRATTSVENQQRPISTTTDVELPPAAQMPDNVALTYNVTGEDKTDGLNSVKRASDGQMLDTLTTPAGKDLDIETSTLRAKAIQTYETQDNDKVFKLPALHLQEVKSDKKELVKAKLVGKARFRKYARMVKTNLAWLRDTEEKSEDEGTTVYKGTKDDEELSFNVNNFKLSQMMYGGISQRAAKILAKHPQDRQASDIRVLMDIISRLQCFSKYSTAAKQELARIIFYERIEAGRVVIQQGHIGLSFYFIVAGTVNVRFTEIDKNTGGKRTLYLGQLSEGSSFGELALLHNIRRTATIVCRGDCQFLRVDKADFQEVLGQVAKMEYDRRLNILQRLESFKDWTPEELAACNAHSRIVEYTPNTMIHGEGSEVTDFVLYVVSGECYIVRQLLLIKRNLDYGGHRLLFPSEAQVAHHQYQQAKQRGAGHASIFESMEQHHWAMYSLGKYNYFGVGENLEKTYFISKTKVEVLQVPKVNFSKVGRTKTLDLMRENLNKSIPSDRTLYEKYIADLKWCKYKNKLVNDVLSCRPHRLNACLNDVPLSIRKEPQSVFI